MTYSGASWSPFGVMTGTRLRLPAEKRAHGAAFLGPWSVYEPVRPVPLSAPELRLKRRWTCMQRRVQRLAPGERVELRVRLTGRRRPIRIGIIHPRIIRRL